MNKKLVIIGYGGHGKVVADIASKLNKWVSIAFLDDQFNADTQSSFQVVGTIQDKIKFKNKADFFVAIGDNHLRKEICFDLFTNGFDVVSIIDPSAIIGQNVMTDKGTVVMPGVVINNNTSIGKGCIINTSSSIDHDNEILDYVHISPGVNLGGTVKISNNSWIGIGSVVINNIEIGSNCIVGAGTVVIKSLLESGTYIGNPARKIK